MGMSEEIRVCRAVEQLLKDRDENARFGDSPVDLTPPNLPEGYKVQDALIKRYQDRGQGIDSWKVGLSGKSMQQSVGIPHPIEGPILESLSHNEHVDLSNADFVHNVGCVLGPSIENWQETNLAAEKLSINLNEVFIGRGTGAAVLDHPFNSVA